MKTEYSPKRSPREEQPGVARLEVAPDGFRSPGAARCRPRGRAPAAAAELDAHAAPEGRCGRRQVFSMLTTLR